MRRTERDLSLPKTLAIAGVTSALAVAALAAQPAHAAVASVEIDGKVIYSAKAKAALAKVPGATYDAKSKTLTLKNLKLTPKSKASVKRGAIYIQSKAADTVNVVLKGDNSITAGRAGCSGVKTDGKLILKGSGLTTTGMKTALSAPVITIGKGTYSFKGCTKAGISATKLVKIKGSTGGTVSVTTTTPEHDTAIAASKGTVQNEYKRLGTIQGKLGKGATYNHSGSTFQVVSADNVKLVSYGAGKEADVSSDTFGKNTYEVREICARAFNNSHGAKVTKIKLGPALRVIGKEAFYGTERLNDLVLTRWFGGILGSLDVLSYDALTKRFGTSDIKIDAKAFKGCGELAGFNLAAHTGVKSKKVNLAVKAALTLRGYPLLAQVTV